MVAKRFLSLMLALTLIFTAVVLASCSKMSDSQTEGKTDTSGSSGNTGDSSEGAGSGSGSESDEAPVEIKYFGWNDEKSYLEPAIDDFNAQSSNIKVSYSFMVPDDYYVKVLTLLSSGNADFDVFSVNGIDKLNQYLQVGGLADLTPFIEKNNVDLSKYGPSMQTLKLNEKYYVLPYRSSSYAIFYNKDIFDNAGEPYPIDITWEEYAQIAKRLTSGSGDSKIWGGYIPDWLRAPIMTLQRGSNLLDDDLTPIIEWSEYLNRLYNIDMSHMSYAEMKLGKIDWIKIFESGKVAMLPNGEWTIAMLNADKEAGLHNINWDVAPLPVINKGDVVKSPGGVSTYMGVYSGSKNIEAAFELVESICGVQGEKILAEKGVLTAYVDDEIKEAFKKASGVSGTDALLNAETYPEAEPIPQMAAIYQAYEEEKELYLTGQQTIEKFAENFARKREEALKE